MWNYRPTVLNTASRPVVDLPGQGRYRSLAEIKAMLRKSKCSARRLPLESLSVCGYTADLMLSLGLLELVLPSHHRGTVLDQMEGVQPEDL